MRLLLLLLLCLPVWLRAQPLKPAASYLNNPKISKTAKTVYRIKSVSLEQAERYFSVLDSLSSANDTTRPFYFSLLPKLTAHADGYVSEVIGSKFFELLEKHPQYIFHFFIANPGRKKQLQSMGRYAAFGMQLWCNGKLNEAGEPMDRESCFEALEKIVKEKCSGTTFADSDVYRDFMSAFKGSRMW